MTRTTKKDLDWYAEVINRLQGLDVSNMEQTGFVYVQKYPGGYMIMQYGTDSFQPIGGGMGVIRTASETKNFLKGYTVAVETFLKK